jgi:hypothetical protein
VLVAEKCEGLINSGWGGELSGILDLRGGKNGGLLTSEDCLGLRNMLLYFSHWSCITLPLSILKLSDFFFFRIR